MSRAALRPIAALAAAAVAMAPLAAGRAQSLGPPPAMNPAGSNAAPAALANFGLGGLVGVVPHGARCDVIQVEDDGSGTVLTATGTAGQATVAFAGTGAPNFTADDIGKRITITGGGAAGGVLVAPIDAVIDAHTIALGADISTALSATKVAVSYGHADDNALSSAAAAVAAYGGTLWLPGKCGVTAAFSLPSLGVGFAPYNAGVGSIVLAGASNSQSALVALAPISGGGVLEEPAVYHHGATIRDVAIDANGLADYAYFVRGGTGARSFGAVFKNALQAELRLGSDGSPPLTQNYGDFGSYLWKDALVMSGVSAPYNLLIQNGTDSKFYDTTAAFAATANVYDAAGAANRWVGTHVWGPAQIGYHLFFKDDCNDCEVNGASVTGIEVAGQAVTITGGWMDFPALSPYTGICGIDIAAGTTDLAQITGVKFHDIPASQFFCESGSKNTRQLSGRYDVSPLMPYLPSASLRQLMAKTTGATPTVLTTDNQAAGTGNIPLIDGNSAQVVDGLLQARVTNGANNGQTASWKITYACKRGNAASTTALDGTPTVTAVGANAGWAAPTIGVDPTNGACEPTVTGFAGNTVWWRFTYSAATSN